MCMLTHTYPLKPLRKIKVVCCNQQTDCQCLHVAMCLIWLVCNHGKELNAMVGGGNHSSKQWAVNFGVRFICKAECPFVKLGIIK